MSFTSLINLRHCKVTRKIDMLLKKTTITLNPVLDYQPPTGQPGCMEIHITGCTTGDGTITVDGTDINGAALSESITFTANGVEVGEDEFQVVTLITTFGFIDEAIVGDIEIKLVSPSGQPIYWEIPIFDEMPCWVDAHRGGLSFTIPGVVITGITKLFCKHDPSNPLQEADLVYYRDRKYRIDFIEEVMSRGATPHHLELILEQAKTNED